MFDKLFNMLELIYFKGRFLDIYCCSPNVLFGKIYCVGDETSQLFLHVTSTTDIIFKRDIQMK